MRKASVSALVALSVLLVITRASAAPVAPDYTKVGVKLGDTTIYRINDASYPCNRSRIVVHGIVGSIVILNQTLYYPDGSVASDSQVPTDLRTGIGITWLLLAANLTVGDHIYSTYQQMVNETVQRMVAGALRTLNHANFASGIRDFYWDQLTGVATELHFLGMLSRNWTLLSTTAWAPDTVPSLLNMTTIALIEGVVILVLAIAVIYVASRRKRR